MPVTNSPKITKLPAKGGEVTALAANTTLIPTMTTICGMTPTAASMAKSNAANGPIQDIIGNNGLALNHFKESARLVSYLQKVTDQNDPILVPLNSIYNSLVGSGAPVSNAIIVTMSDIISVGPKPATQAKCNAAAGPILDYIGNCNGSNLMFMEARNILTLVDRDLDASDPMKPMIADILVTLEMPPETPPDVPSVTLSPTSQSFGPAGGAGAFTVTVTGLGESLSWEVTKDAVATWLTILSPTTPQSTVSGPVDYAVTNNITGAARTANMYVNGKTFVVSQSA